MLFAGYRLTVDWSRGKVILSDWAEFHADGVMVQRGFFGAAFVSGFDHAVSQVHTDIRNNRLKRVGRFVEGGPLPDYLACMPQRNELREELRALMITPHIALYNSRLLLKDSGFSGAVELHQDMPYFTGGRKISVFVPLMQMRANDGGLCFVKGSRKYGMLERGVIQLDKFPPMEHLRPDLEPGDVIFMDFLTWHYSGPCYSERPLMQITFQPATDGSYFDLPGPTLVSGEWQTSYFVEKGKCVKPDA